MQQKISLRLLPSEAADDKTVRSYLAAACGRKFPEISGYTILRKSIDARGRQPWVNLTAQVYVQEPVTPRNSRVFSFRDVRQATERVVIIGAGPAGLFAALQLIEKGIKPIILERGKDVRARRRDLAAINKEGRINPESNYCFGEGGAGTYSDGKLYTRSTKRGDTERILQLFVQFGAPENILYEAHPHIGTNKLPGIITAMRQQIIDCGGEIHFNSRVTDFNVTRDRVRTVQTAEGNRFDAAAFILATGHSARDIFQLLATKGILIESKPFALGVRVEHPQALIDRVQYHCTTRDRALPPAAYSLVQQVNHAGVFSFCMCPGGIIAPAATNNNEIVVNGWSPSKRNNPFANSGIVTEIKPGDFRKLNDIQYSPAWDNTMYNSPLAMMYFQQYVEQKAFRAGGGSLVAPAQRLTDFVAGRSSASLPDCSYLPGITPAQLTEVLPLFVAQRLQQAFQEFGKKMKGFLTVDAVVVATESRTSSPVRIPRDPQALHHPQLKNFYPCGEGAGYAGGIMSAAMDGEKLALMISSVIQK